MERFYYFNSISGFKKDLPISIYGELSKRHSHDLETQQKNAWLNQIEILRSELKTVSFGYIFFEFSIPRMGKRVDNILIIGDKIFVIEFKVGSVRHERHAIDQVLDYGLDLKNFHAGSHSLPIIPVLISTYAKSLKIEFKKYSDNVFVPIKATPSQLEEILNFSDRTLSQNIDPLAWSKSSYKPTPTIIEAAQALYLGHGVEAISRSDAGAINLSKTSDCINRVIDETKEKQRKTICFITGVPGAGKTLAGLNIAMGRKNFKEDENAVFLSGNGPLVQVLREALARDKVIQAQEAGGEKLMKKTALSETKSFIQNIHHFRDDALEDKKAPSERVVIFDEAQRAWTSKKASDFMRIRKGVQDFNMSEPEFLISVLDRHEGWSAIICLIGGGQEINDGEAGLREWISALNESFGHWDVYYSRSIIENKNYLAEKNLIEWILNNGKEETDLHLGVSIRSFRSEYLSGFIYHALELDRDKAREINLQNLQGKYPIKITRDKASARKWLKEKARGTERIGIVASSGALRLKPFGINVKHKIDAPVWFLNDKEDVRSSYFLEDVATEFDIQGLELDWIAVCWGADLFLTQEMDQWIYRKFSGTKWMNVRKEINRTYLLNTYRVLMTRARQGLVIFIPHGDDEDGTRLSEYYDYTYQYLRSLGIDSLE